MIGYTAALPNKHCQTVIDRMYPAMRYMLSPACVRSFGPNRYNILYRGYAIDNGAYSYWVKNEPFNVPAFMALLDAFADRCDWIAIPDAVGDWAQTQRIMPDWVARLDKYNKPLLAVAQNGSQVDQYSDLHALLQTNIAGLFIGGTTEWKLQHIQGIANVCQQYGKICHVGRVNSAKRIQFCNDAGATSIDGSGASRFKHTARIVSCALQSINQQHTINWRN